jgi:hypothetical protein
LWGHTGESKKSRKKAEPIGERKEICNAGVKISSQANNSAKGKQALQRWGQT